MWKTIGVSVGLPSKLVCQDAHRWHCPHENVLLMSVADGAGTAPLAEIGSNIASQAALDYLNQHVSSFLKVPEETEGVRLVRGALESGRLALCAEAERRQTPLNHLSTTLIVVVATQNLVTVAQIGDGMVFVADGANQILRLTAPQRGEYSNETHMLTSVSALEEVEVVTWSEPITGIAAMTDGLLPITTTLPDYQPFAPFFTNLFTYFRKIADPQEAEAKLRSFLLSDRVQNGTGDDLTLVVGFPV